MTDSPSPDRGPGGADPTLDVRRAALPSLGRPAAHRPTTVDQATDELDPSAHARQRTIAFSSPEMAQGRPLPTIGPTARRARRWPWIALAAVPVLVIAVSGVWLILLLRAA